MAIKKIEDISARMDEAINSTVRLKAFERWENEAPEEELDAFRQYLEIWLRKRADGITVSWSAFAEICSTDIPSFKFNEQQLRSVLRERIRRL